MRAIASLSPFVQQVLERYETHAPVALAVRVALEQTFASPEIDAIFETTRRAQYDRTLHFSTVVDVMVGVVTQTVPSVYAGLVALGESLPVSHAAFYNKLNHTETPHRGRARRALGPQGARRDRGDRRHLRPRSAGLSTQDRRRGASGGIVQFGS